MTADFMTAENEPTDTSLAYGAMALGVLPLIPASVFFMDIFFPDGFGEESAETTGGEAAT